MCHQRGYKVLEKKGNRYYSFTQQKPIRQTYKKKGWTTRKSDNGPLAVFNTINDAKRFLYNNISGLALEDHVWVIAEVEYAPSKARPDTLWAVDAGHTYPDGTHRVLIRQNLPAGTIRADAVRVIKEVEEVVETKGCITEVFPNLRGPLAPINPFL